MADGLHGRPGLKSNLLVSLIALSSLLVALPATAWEEGDAQKCPATGLYTNSYYGFRVRIPDGLRGCPNSPVWLSDHGVFIPLDGPRRSLEAYAGYNAVLFESPDLAATNSLEWVEDRAVKGSVVVDLRSAVTVSGLKGVRLVVRYVDRESQVPMIQDKVHLLRSITTGVSVPSHEYCVSLVTTAESYSTDRKLLEELLSSWQATKI